MPHGIVWTVKPEGLGALQSSVSPKAYDSHSPRKEGKGVTRQGGINPIHPNFLHYPVLQVGWPRNHDPPGRILAKGGPWFCIDSVEGLEQHSTQEPVRRRGNGVKALVQGHLEGLWLLEVNLPENWKSQTISIWEGRLQDLFLWICSRGFPKNWTWAGSVVACSTQC